MSLATVGSSRRERARLRIARNLARLRDRAGLSVADCAERVGVSRWSWVRWEAGGQVPLDLLPLICAALAAEVDDIVPASATNVRRAA